MISWTRPLLAALVATALVVGGLAWRAQAQGADVDVQQAYFVAAQPAGADLNLSATLFMTNEGAGESDRVSVTVFVVPHASGLASYTTKLEVGRIDGRTTSEVVVPLTIPNYNATRNYRVDFLVVEDGLLTQRGQGFVGWGGGHGPGYAAEDASGGVRSAQETLSAQAPAFERVR